MSKKILTNTNGVDLVENYYAGHCGTPNAKCCCNSKLIVAPALFHAEHEKGNPIMVCEDMGLHAYEFKDLVIGINPINKLLERRE